MYFIYNFKQQTSLWWYNFIGAHQCTLDVLTDTHVLLWKLCRPLVLNNKFKSLKYKYQTITNIFLRLLTFATILSVIYSQILSLVFRILIINSYCASWKCNVFKRPFEEVFIGIIYKNSYACFCSFIFKWSNNSLLLLLTGLKCFKSIYSFSTAHFINRFLNDLLTVAQACLKKLCILGALNTIATSYKQYNQHNWHTSVDCSHMLTSPIVFSYDLLINTQSVGKSLKTI